MPRTLVIGDGPGGLTAALFLAKNDHDTVVVGTDDTAMHFALLKNYPGIPEITGTDWQAVVREQVAGFGADLRAGEVVSVEGTPDGFAAVLDGGDRIEADFLVLGEGRDADLAASLGAETTDDGVVVDLDHRSSVDGVYVVGRSVRPNRSQAVISAGAGAVAALDILSRVAGTDVRDWDSPPKD
ncbi:MAG: FAD-dependent oxidoreductase [Acidimicrobiia bacterium]|nr:FAD-dependent oxidoreductase [Acidimicrobiia bacterium]